MRKIFIGNLQLQNIAMQAATKLRISAHKLLKLVDTVIPHTVTEYVNRVI